MDINKDNPTTDTAYDRIASWYHKQIDSDSLTDKFIFPYLIDLLGEITSLHICDLACGQGKITRGLAQQGAIVVGVDLSDALLRIARQYENIKPLGITYLQDNAEKLASLADESFDGVVCNMALMDIPDLQATFSAIWRVLRRKGWFVFSLTHPCFQAPYSQWTYAPDGSVRREVAHYFDEGFWRSDNPEGVRGQVGAHHRMLSTYLNTLVQVGFSLERIVEPQAKQDVGKQVPGYANVPAFIILRVTKSARIIEKTI